MSKSLLISLLKSVLITKEKMSIKRNRWVREGHRNFLRKWEANCCARGAITQYQEEDVPTILCSENVLYLVSE